jgi:hypothetical protein
MTTTRKAAFGKSVTTCILNHTFANIVGRMTQYE